MFIVLDGASHVTRGTLRRLPKFLDLCKQTYSSPVSSSLILLHPAQVRFRKEVNATLYLLLLLPPPPPPPPPPLPIHSCSKGLGFSCFSRPEDKDFD